MKKKLSDSDFRKELLLVPKISDWRDQLKPLVQDPNDLEDRLNILLKLKLKRKRTEVITPEGFTTIRGAETIRNPQETPES